MSLQQDAQSNSNKERQLQHLQTILESLLPKIRNELRSIDTPYKLADGQLYVMMMIEKLGSCKASDIATQLGITSGGVTALTDKLVSLELLQRERPENDRRVVLLSLTVKGREAAKQIRKLRLQQLKALFGNFDEQQLSSLTYIFDTLNKEIEKKQQGE